MAATLPFSRSHEHQAALEPTSEFGEASTDPYDQWGPNSVPPTSNSNIPWDEQVVPALRKKLEQESSKLGRRISAIEASDGGWTTSAIRSRESLDRRDIRPQQTIRNSLLEEEQEVDASLGGSTSSHSRTSHLGRPSVDPAESRDFRRNGASVAQARTRVQSSAASVRLSGEPLSRSGSVLRGGSGRDDATARAVERARQLARERAESIRAGDSGDTILARTRPAANGRSTGSTTPRTGSIRQKLPQQQQQQQQQRHYGQLADGPSSRQAAPAEAYDAPAQPRASQSSFERQRLRTHSTPMKYAGPSSGRRPSGQAELAEGATGYPTTPQGQNGISNGSSHGLYPSSAPPNSRQPLSRVERNTSPIDGSLDEFGPLGGVKPESAKSTPTRVGSKRSNPTLQPDAFRSLSPHRYAAGPDASLLQASSAGRSVTDEFGSMGKPPVVSVTKPTSANAWDDEIIPTVARRLQQQMLMAGDPRLSNVDGFIDTWDRNGLPLSKSEVARRIKQVQDEAAASGAGEGGAREEEGGQRNEEAIREAEARLAGRSHDSQLQRPDRHGGETIEMQPVQRSSQQDERYSVQSRSRRSHAGDEDVASAVEQGSQDAQQRQQQVEAEQRAQQMFQPTPAQPMVASDHHHQQQQAAKRPAQVQRDEDAGCCKCIVM